ncbi:branched-chain amino acid ABC transporter permease [Deltaproteobacteria bacterium OttesenSCG-928-M10]|nr:branched-chain amino acid ABC transporter permease [Deltaproteobacteria bacterium OttesenSCG-928-M10]
MNKVRNPIFQKVFSAATVTVGLTLILLAAATWDRGPYVLINVLVTAGMLSIMAVGLALIFGVMNVGMFAHGEFFMVGTLVGYYFFSAAQAWFPAAAHPTLRFLAPLMGIALSFLAGALVGVVVEKIIFKPLRAKSRENWILNTFLVTVGLGVVMINLHQLLFGSQFKGITDYWPGRPLEILGVYISRDRIAAVTISLVSILAFWSFMRFSRTGRAIRAVSQDETGAYMVGINMPFIITLTLALSCGLAALAGATLLFMYPAYPTVGLEPLYMSWFVVILVGMGNIMGSLLGAVMVATFKVLTVEYVGAGWDFVFPTAFIMLILIFKPSGILGSEVRGVLDQ